MRAADPRSSGLSTDERMVFDALPTRPQVTWPGGRTVAVWHAPNVEHYDYIAPGSGPGGPQGRTPAPDVQHYMHRDAGNRVAFKRMLRAVDRYAIPSTVSLSLSILEEHPEIRDEMLSRDWEVMSHGISNLRPIYDLSYDEEDEFLELSQRLSETYYGGRRIKGMLGPKISGTDDTADLMSKHGMTYHADWIHDEQPRPLRVGGEAAGRLVSMPYSFIVNDVPLLVAKHFDGPGMVELAKAQISRLLRDAEKDGQGRVACIATHPFVSGQPGVSRYLEEIFDFLRSDDRLWITRAGDIADHYLENHYDEQLAHAELRKDVLA